MMTDVFVNTVRSSSQRHLEASRGTIGHYRQVSSVDTNLQKVFQNKSMNKNNFNRSIYWWKYISYFPFPKFSNFRRKTKLTMLTCCQMTMSDGWRMKWVQMLWLFFCLSRYFPFWRKVLLFQQVMSPVGIIQCPKPSRKMTSWRTISPNKSATSPRIWSAKLQTTSLSSNVSSTQQRMGYSKGGRGGRWPNSWTPSAPGSLALKTWRDPLTTWWMCSRGMSWRMSIRNQPLFQNGWGGMNHHGWSNQGWRNWTSLDSVTACPPRLKES